MKLRTDPGGLALLALLLALPWALATHAHSREKKDQAADAAMAAYLQGRYEEALPGLEKVHAEGKASGAQIYMLAYCLEVVRKDSAATSRTYTAAQERLSQEIAGKNPSLESFFYLSNHYQNRKDAAKSKEIAGQAIASIESAAVKVGKDGTSQFRAGKLHSDAGKQERALEFYKRALSAFDLEKHPPPAYVERALEPVARAELGKVEHAVSSAQWERLLKLNPGILGGQWTLATTSLQAGRYAVARDAFKKARAARDERSQEAFYAERLADAANALVAGGATIPAKDRDGQSISGLAEEPLGERLKEISKQASELLGREPRPDEYEVLPPLSEKARARLKPTAKFSAEISEVQRVFVALVIDLFRRGSSIQESAFTGGYAPLIIQNWTDLWKKNHAALIEKPAPPA